MTNQTVKKDPHNKGRLTLLERSRSIWQPLKDAICNPELPFEIISDILKPILDRHGYMPVLAMA